MFCSKNLVSDYKEIDNRWIFQFYCKIEALEGQDVKIKSLFNTKERFPSMIIGIPKNGETYRFKCFSTGKSGSAVDLVKELFNLTFHQAVNKIVEDYNEYVLKNGCDLTLGEFKKHSKYQVKSFLKREWTTQDQYFWTQYNIGSKLLNRYNVIPLENYTMVKEEEQKELEISGLYIYGYLKEDGSIYKIYQPKVQDKKFIKVKDYMQGSEQLKGYDNLIILSGLKDLMALSSLNLKIDTIAGASETSLIGKEDINKYQQKYKNILTLMDQDEAGINSSKKYEEIYHTKPVYMVTDPIIKDVADLLKQWGPRKSLEYLVPRIQQALDINL